MIDILGLIIIIMMTCFSVIHPNYSGECKEILIFQKNHSENIMYSRNNSEL